MSTRPTILITGAAKRIGAAIARHLAHEGYDLVLHYRDSGAEAEALAATLRDAYPALQVTLVRADLAETEQLSRFWQGLPPVTHLVHNAASFTREPFTQFAPAQLRSHLAVNLEAPLILTQGFLAQLPEGASGSVTVLGDGAQGASLSPNFFPYAVSKLAWESVIALLAASLAPRARANLITLGLTLPGPVEGPEIFAQIAARSPLGRALEPGEVARCVARAIAHPQLSGQIIALDDGIGLSEPGAPA